MAAMTLISMPMAKNWRSSSSDSPVRSKTTCWSTSKVRRQLRAMSGSARGGGKAVQLDLEQFGILHQLEVGGSHGGQCVLALEALADAGSAR